MDVDTPPRPTATASTSIFSFQSTTTQSPPTDISTPHLEFDASTFSPKKAFGLGRTQVVEEVHPVGAAAVDKDENLAAVTFVGGFRGEAGGSGGEARRRRGGRNGDRRKQSSSSSAAATTFEEEYEEEEEEEGGMRPLSSKNFGAQLGSKEFSFQVHHHHGSSSTSESKFPAPPEKWLNSHTPYTLLG